MADPNNNAPEVDGVAALQQVLRDTSEKMIDGAYSKIAIKELSRMPTPKVQTVAMCSGESSCCSLFIRKKPSQEWSAACKAINKCYITMDAHKMSAKDTTGQVGYSGFVMIHALKAKIHKDNDPVINEEQFENMMSAYENMRLEHGAEKTDRVFGKTIAKAHALLRC